MAVSFSAAAKAEVCRVIPHKQCCALAECFGILLYCNCFQTDGIKIITESREFAYILPKLFKKAFDVSFDSYPSMEAPGKLVFQIWDEEKIGQIMDSFGFDMEQTLSLHVNFPVVEDDCCNFKLVKHSSQITIWRSPQLISSHPQVQSFQPTFIVSHS